MAVIEQRTLITIPYLALYSPLPQNYDYSEIKPYIHVSEKIWIEPIIGTPLYETLLDEVEDDDVTPEHATLLLNIYPLLSFATVYEALPFVAFHMTEVGITKGKSENSDSIVTKDVNYISNHLKSQIEVMKTLLKKFLEEHANLYPEYFSDANNCTCTTTTTEEECDCRWIYDYYDGTYDKYQWLRDMAAHNMRKFKPDAWQQLYATRRNGISLR